MFLYITSIQITIFFAGSNSLTTYCLTPVGQGMPQSLVSSKLGPSSLARPLARASATPSVLEDGWRGSVEEDSEAGRRSEKGGTWDVVTQSTCL